MNDITYDAEGDAVHIAVGHGKIDRTDEAGPFIYDVDTKGRIVGIEILSASKVLAPGDWKEANPRRGASAPSDSGSDSARQRMASRRAEGLRLVQHWVPDLRDPEVLADIHRQAKLMAQHPENDAIDAWNEETYDWSGWK